MIAVMAALILTACGDNKAEEVSTSDTQQAQGLVLRVALEAGRDDVQYKAVQQFAQDVDALSKGEIKVDIFDSGSQGGEIELLESIKNNEDKVDIVIAEVSNLKHYAETVDISKIPFAFSDYEKLKKFLESEVQSETEKTLKDSNMCVLTHYVGDVHGLLMTKEQIMEAKDLQDKMIAVDVSNAADISMKAMGALTGSVEKGQIESVLMQGLYDGYAGSLEEIYTKQYYKNQRYFAATNHYFEAYGFVINESTWGQLEEESREIISQAAENSADAAYSIQKQEYDLMLRQMESNNIKVLYPITETFWGKIIPIINGMYPEYGNLTEQLITWR